MTKPSPQDVAKRLVILKYQVVHALAMPPQDYILNLFSQWSRQDRRSFQQTAKSHSKQLVASMKANDLWRLMTREEKAFIKSVPPKHKHQSHLNATWRMESAVVLMWACKLVEEFPGFDTQSDPKLLQQIPDKDLDGFVKSAALRPEKEIEEKRSLAELWHWRSRTRQLIERNETPPKEFGFETLDEIVLVTANESFKQGDIPQVIDGDFPAKGKAYRDLSAEEWSEVGSITFERHFALNWLCGYAPGNQWDQTPTDT